MTEQCMLGDDRAGGRQIPWQTKLHISKLKWELLTQHLRLWLILLDGRVQAE